MTTYTWDTTSGDWNTASNWTPTGIPTVVDQADFEAAPGTYTVSGNASAQYVVVSAENNVTFTGAISAAGRATDSPNVFPVGVFLSSSAVLTIAAGASLSVPNAGVSLASADIQGPDGPSTLEINGIVTDDNAEVSAGVVSVSGGGAVWLNSGTVGVGGSAGAVVSVANGAMATGNFALVPFSTFELTPSATFSGSLELAGGTVQAMDDPGQTDAGAVVIGQSVTIDPSAGGASALIDSVAGTTLTSLFLIAPLAGTGELAIAGGTVAIEQAGAHSFSFSDDSATLVFGTGTPTVTGGSGSDTVFAGNADVALNGGSGVLTFLGQSGSDSVYGGSGSVTAYGGTGGGNVLIGGQRTSVLVGGGGGDLLVAGSNGPTTLIAAGGNTTLTGAGTNGNNLFFAASNSEVVTGLGNSTVVTNGNATVFGGSLLSTNVFNGSGDVIVVAGTGSGYIQAGNGSETVFADAGRFSGFGFCQRPGWRQRLHHRLLRQRPN